jgi:hypothetical protein
MADRTGQSADRYRTTTGSSSKTPVRKRDVRADTRKGTWLTAKQLERKRASAREAQRTKEHIINLEHQFTHLSTKVKRMDEVLQRNAALEAEISHVQHQLSIMIRNRLHYPGSNAKPHPRSLSRWLTRRGTQV